YFSHKRPMWRLARARILHTGGALVALLTLAACGGGDGDGSAQVSCTPIYDEHGKWITDTCSQGSSDGGEPSPQAVACKGLDNQEVMVQPKTITIHNNSEKDRIYPVLATSTNAVNEWLQGCFRTAADYPTKSVYKLYVNEG